MITADTITDAQIRELEEMVLGGLIDVGPIDDCGDPDHIIDDCVTALDEAGLATEHEAHAVARREARARCAEILNARATSSDPFAKQCPSGMFCVHEPPCPGAANKVRS